jgi:uncharacterized protein YdeI (YjbR/CyaY-like superfamily)
MQPKLYTSNREEWRSWLMKNHTREKEIWLVFFKKKSARPSIDYRDSVEEALCFGWIDGLKKGIDEQSYAYRFTPRKTRSKWSPLNIELANRMIKEGKMTEAGLAAFKRRKKYDEEIVTVRKSKTITLTPEIERALKANKTAWDNFNNLAPGYQKQYIGWIASAKKPETRKRRLSEVIIRLEENKKPGMK